MEDDVRDDEPRPANEVIGDARDTIFALSSGSPPAAIAIIRISGPEAEETLRRLCGTLPAPRYATLRTLRDEQGERLDRALVLWFPGRSSATGEDLAELHLHGGRAVVAAVLAALGGLPGCRAAAAGEFTRRAFANGRIDLLQAEGLADLLSAETEGARRRALRLAEGGLSRLIDGWRNRLTLLGARIEAVLEFGGDDPDIPPDPTIQADIAALAEEMRSALAAPPAERLRDGVRVLLAGPPNSGKSTLFNALAGRDVAIATPIPGTTRDLIEAPVTIEGVAMVLIDSAGLREAEDEVERIGIERTRRALAEADIILWLGNPDARPEGGSVLAVRTKADLPLAAELTEADIIVSATTGRGIAALHHRLTEMMVDLLPTVDLALTASQRGFVEEATASLSASAAGEEADETLIAERLRHASAALDMMIGRYAVEPMLEALFGRFCIGK